MRQQTCTTVTLRQRPIRNGRISLYLDYYPAVRNPKTMQLSRREYLGFYIYATPKNIIGNTKSTRFIPYNTDKQ